MECMLATDTSLTQYIREVDLLPRLRAEETAALGQRILLANQGKLSRAEGLAARDAIIEGHLHLVISLTQRYPLAYREDLVQEGNLGLMATLEHYTFPADGNFVGRKLARAARVSDDVAIAYLQRMMHTPSANASKPLGEKTYAKLLQVYRQLQARHTKLTVQALQQASGANWNTVKRFLEQLRQREQKESARREAVEA